MYKIKERGNCINEMLWKTLTRCHRMNMNRKMKLDRNTISSYSFKGRYPLPCFSPRSHIIIYAEGDTNLLVSNENFVTELRECAFVFCFSIAIIFLKINGKK